MVKFVVKIANVGDWYSPEIKRVYKNTPIFVDNNNIAFVLNDDGTRTEVQPLTEKVVCDQYYNIIDKVYEEPIAEDEETNDDLAIYKKITPATTHEGSTIKNDYRIFNTEKVRSLLTTKIYISKKEGTYYYNTVTQELLNKVDNYFKNTYYLKGSNGAYYLEGKDEITSDPIYAYVNGSYRNIGMVNNENVFVPLNMQYINEEQFDVTYTKFLIYREVEGQMELVTNAIIYPEWKLDCPFMITPATAGGVPETVFVEKIKNPIMYDNKLNPHINYGKDIVLPYVTEDDIRTPDNENSYVQMFDDTTEILPEWKRDDPYFWESLTKYSKDSVIYNNGKYYIAKEDFTSGETFTKESLYGPLTETELDTYLPRKYFPTLDLMCCNVGQNNTALAELNAQELQGKYWYGKKFAFFDLIFEPIFNKNIAKFGIKFYNSQYENSPEFLLMP